MNIVVVDYISVYERCIELGLQPAAAQVRVLPSNFSECTSIQEWEYTSTETTVRLLLNDIGIASGILENDANSRKLRSRHSLVWYGPVLFFAVSELTQNPHLLSLSLGVIANYLTDHFRGLQGTPKVRLEIVTEKTKSKTTRKFCYEGDITGLKVLEDTILREVKNETFD
jgi:hypothetical protein